MSDATIVEKLKALESSLRRNREHGDVDTDEADSVAGDLAEAIATIERLTMSDAVSEPDDPPCRYCGKPKDSRWHDCDPWDLHATIERLERERGVALQWLHDTSLALALSYISGPPYREQQP